MEQKQSLNLRHPHQRLKAHLKTVGKEKDVLMMTITKTEQNQILLLQDRYPQQQQQHHHQKEGK